ncbi:MAG: hypothetical protein H6626_08000 [Pseudobdellovibrionaceae bacterium]|nr:hypothetical protein [Bdellovibrionales bacterium]USN46166.1 MAG: hypothetical protein H6626_08000 [Pseudobdellovibrionaceae bacterium]
MIAREAAALRLAVSIVISVLVGCQLADNRINGRIIEASGTPGGSPDITNTLQFTGPSNLATSNLLDRYFDAIFTITGNCDPSGGQVALGGAGIQSSSSEFLVTECLVEGGGYFSFDVSQLPSADMPYIGSGINPGWRQVTVTQGGLAINTELYDTANFTVVKINSKADLQAIPYGPASSNKLYILQNDIDLSEGGAVPTNNWTPIGGGINVFNGFIDGFGHTIFNMHIDGGGNGDIGFVGRASGTVRDLTFHSVTIENAVDCVGSVIGDKRISGLIKNVSVIGGNVTGATRVGGVVGCIDDGIDTASYEGNVTATGDYVGGIIGEGSSLTVGVYGLAFKGGIITSPSGNKVGGVLGGGGVLSKLVNSYAVGVVEGANEVGGLIGLHGNNNIENCFVAMNVVATSGPDAGYIIGSSGGGIYTNVFFANDLACTNCVLSIGSGVPSVNMYNQATFIGFDFDSVWSIDEGVIMPDLRGYKGNYW